jgi:hypothetical protein
VTSDSNISSISASSLASSFVLIEAPLMLSSVSCKNTLISADLVAFSVFLEGGAGVLSLSSSLSSKSACRTICFLPALRKKNYEPLPGKVGWTYAARFGKVRVGATEAGGVFCPVELSSSSSSDVDSRRLLQNGFRCHVHKVKVAIQLTLLCSFLCHCVALMEARNWPD